MRYDIDYVYDNDNNFEFKFLICLIIVIMIIIFGSVFVGYKCIKKEMNRKTEINSEKEIYTMRDWEMRELFRTYSASVYSIKDPVSNIEYFYIDNYHGGDQIIKREKGENEND